MATKVKCPLCNGDGRETCTNPDHGLIDILYFHDIGRIGCPCCGHDENHKVINGGECDLCCGSGLVDEDIANNFIEEYYGNKG